MKQIKIINHRLTNFLHTVLLLGAMLGLLSVVGLLMAGTEGLLWAILLGATFLLLSQGIPPQFVLRMAGARPLAPYEAPGLFDLVERLAYQAGVTPPPRLYYVPNPAMNAFTVGDGTQAAIALTDGLLRRLDGRELAGVLAHELSHLRHNDLQVLRTADMIGRVTGLFSTLGQILLLLNFPLLLIGRAVISWPAILLLIAAPTLSGLLQLALSRTREFDADLGAVRLTGDPYGLASALQKMEAQHLPPLARIFRPGYRTPPSSILLTHPSTQERVRRLLDLVDEFPQPSSVDLARDLISPSHLVAGPRPPRGFRLGLWG